MAALTSLAGKSVLLAGGYGVVGSQVAEILRREHPELKLIIAGRRKEPAEILAKKLCNAEAALIDMHAVDPLKSVNQNPDAVAVLVHDFDDAMLKSAVARRLPYLDITRGGQAQARAYVTASQLNIQSPVLFASNWMAGVPAILACHLASTLSATDSITLSILFYGNDKGGPDSEDASSTLAEPFEARVDGSWKHVASMSDPINVRFPSGLERPVYRMAMADGITLAQATGARDVAIRLGLDNATTGRITRFMVRTGIWKWLQSERMTWLRKKLSHNPSATGAPHEIVIEVTGKHASGQQMTRRATLNDPAGQSHLTAVGAVAGLERLLGLGMEPIRPGLAVPETAPDPVRLMTLLKAHNVELTVS